jgi:hypothetical protein
VQCNSPLEDTDRSSPGQARKRRARAKTAADRADRETELPAAAADGASAGADDTQPDVSDRHSSLTAAKTAKNDEFYTQWADIEREMNAYLEYDPDVFRDKVILLPCDDPEWSNFTKFFASNFAKFGLRRLVSSCYVSGGRGKKMVLDAPVTSSDDLCWEYLDGDGDFRSAEVTALRDEADIVVTNPPFSLFRDFFDWLVTGNVKFAVIGNMNAITYKEVFPLIKSNLVWLGNNCSVNGGAMFYEIPESIANLDQVRQIVEDSNGKKTYITRVQGVRWFTNLEHGRRHEPLQLMTQADNVKYSKHKKVREVGYSRYDNYDAIEVPFVNAIPSDYPGVMGVPISFLDKYNPDQFEIVGASDNGAVDEKYKLKHFKRHNEPYVAGNKVYKRLLIRHRRAP